MTTTEAACRLKLAGSVFGLVLVDDVSVTPAWVTLRVLAPEDRRWTTGSRYVYAEWPAGDVRWQQMELARVLATIRQGVA